MPDYVDLMLREALLPGSPWSAKVDKTGKTTFVMETPEMEDQKGAGKPKEGAPAAPASPSPPQIPFSAYASMLAPSIGPSPAELKGLTPQQVMSVMDALGAAREVGRKTMADIEGWGLGEAQRKLIEARTREAMAPEVPTALEEARTGEALRRTEVLRPPLTFEQRMELRKEGPPGAPRRPTTFEQKMPVTAYETVRDSVLTEDAAGNLVISDQPDVAKMTAANEVFAEYGLEIVDVDIEPIKKIGWFGRDWLAKDVPGQRIYVVTEAGQEVPRPTRQQVTEALVSIYGWSPEDAAKAKIAEPETGKERRERRKRGGAAGKF